MKNQLKIFYCFLQLEGEKEKLEEQVDKLVVLKEEVREVDVIEETFNNIVNEVIDEVFLLENVL